MWFVYVRIEHPTLYSMVQAIKQKKHNFYMTHCVQLAYKHIYTYKQKGVLQLRHQVCFYVISHVYRAEGRRYFKFVEDILPRGLMKSLYLYSATLH